MNNKFPELFQFFAGYFHQDWHFDYETEDEVVKSFVAESSSEMVSRVKEELKIILRDLQSEEQLQTFLFEEIGCSYYYPHAWPSGKAWLEHILGML